LNARQNSVSFTVLLGVLVALPALGTDFYVPALPDIAAEFDVPAAAAQFTLTTYFIGLAAGQLLWGPLSDRFGRRPVLLAGLGAMLATSVAGSLVGSVAALSWLRLVQGLAMSSGAVIVRSVVRDLHAHEQAARLLASVTIVFSIVPIAAPLAGAALAGRWGWKAIFIGLALAAALLAVAVLARLPETAPRERRSMHPAELARTFASILRERSFVAPYLVFLCSQIAVLTWVSNSAFTLVAGYGVSVPLFGVLFAWVMLGQIAGAWASSRLVLRLGNARMLRAGAALLLASGASAACLAWLGASHWLAVVLPFMALLFSTALIAPSATAAALSPFPRAAGAASSLIGAIGFSAGALISFGLGAAFDGSGRPMATLAAAAGLAAFCFERTLLRGKA
jgi:DHA1 family bicyclomycin/chloramphenicol resistance-like MFS transporter